MEIKKTTVIQFWCWMLAFQLIACDGHKGVPSQASIKEIDLKRGDIILCGPPDQQFGTVKFETSCSPATEQDFTVALALLHSFEYDEAEKVFAKIIAADPECAMAYWGVAMSNYHPLWAPPTPNELKKGARAIAIAQSLPKKSGRETGLVEAIAMYYKDWDKTDPFNRSKQFEKAMEGMFKKYEGDKEIAIFYCLALNGSADPADKTLSQQKKAGAILTSLYPGAPDHPGITHYIIHTYDSPELAILALPSAKRYAAIAPSSAHAQHMPSHIFTRLGLWDDCIQSNLASTAAAKCYAENSGIAGHWDEELHGLDYLVYAYLQKGDNHSAKIQYDYLNNIKKVFPVNFKVAYAFAAIPARYLMENKNWKDAANLEIKPAMFTWKDYPWQKAIIHFTRLMGQVHLNNIDFAKKELDELTALYDMLTLQKDAYKANQVKIQAKTGEAWILFAQGNQEKALQLMAIAAEMEDKTQKHPVTPGEIIPAKELLGDMLMKAGHHSKALDAYEANLKTHPNRFNGLVGAGRAAELSQNTAKAYNYYRQLLAIANAKTSSRKELQAASSFLKKRENIALHHSSATVKE